MKNFSELFEPLIGEAAWQIKRGFGSFLTLEFGVPRLEIREPKIVNHLASEKVRKNFEKRRVSVVGYWHLWIQSAKWTIVTKNFRATNDTENNDAVDACLDELDGQILISLKSNENFSSYELQFDLGAILYLASHEDFKEDTQWSLHYAKNEVFCFMFDGSIQAFSE